MSIGIRLSALVSLSIVACVHGKPPAPAPSGAPGYEALLTSNRPEAVLKEPFTASASDPRALKLRALAAWRVGDGVALIQATERLAALGARDPELDAMTALAQAVPAGGKLRQVERDTPAPARFDPAKLVPLIEARAGGEAARFVFDSGAEVTVLDRTVAERWGVLQPEGARVMVQGNVGDVAASFGLLVELEVLGRALRNVPVVIADLSALRQKAGDLAGILAPQDLLASEVIRIDYRQGEIARTGASRGDGIPMVFLQGRALVAVDASLAGGPSGRFAIDTGGRRSTITDRYLQLVEQAGRPLAIGEARSVEVHAIGKTVRQRRHLATARLCLLPSTICIDLANVPIDTTAADAGTGQAGKLGADAFRGRVLELDYPACRLRLE